MDILTDTIKNTIADKLKIQADDIDAIIEAVKADRASPEQAKAFKQIQQELTKRLQDQFGFKIESLEVDVENIKSARDFRVKTESKIPDFLSIIITVGFFGILIFMLVFESRPTETLLILLGSLGTAWIAIVNYWFGSSSGSAAKTELMNKGNRS